MICSRPALSGRSRKGAQSILARAGESTGRMKDLERGGTNPSKDSPKGIQPEAQGCEGTSYPGYPCLKIRTPIGVPSNTNAIRFAQPIEGAALPCAKLLRAWRRRVPLL